MRIQKFLSRAGAASRRKAETLVEQGRVKVNGVVVEELGTRVDPDVDRVELDGTAVSIATRRWIRFHKPPGVVTTVEDTHGRPTIYDRLPDDCRSLRYVGRLDMATEGLLLMTNDGDLANRIQHPSFQVEREYEARVQKIPTAQTIERLRRGIQLEDGFARPTRVDPGQPDGIYGTLSLVLTEGRKREVRRLLEAVGHAVVTLIRVRFGPIRLGYLPLGAWEALSDEEIKALERSVGAPTRTSDQNRET
jgi:pseudouridine synthase